MPPEVATKTKITADELKRIYAEHLGLPKSRVVVHKNPQLGFTATLITGLRDMSAGAAAAEQLTAELRLIYELVDEKMPAA